MATMVAAANAGQQVILVWFDIEIRNINFQRQCI